MVVTRDGSGSGVSRALEGSQIQRLGRRAVLDQGQQSSVNEELKKKTAGQCHVHSMDLNAHIQQIVSAPKQPLNLFNPLSTNTFFFVIKKYLQTYTQSDSTFEIFRYYCNNDFYICALKQDANEKM